VRLKRILLYFTDTLVIIVTPVVEIGSPLSTSMLKSYDMVFEYLTKQTKMGGCTFEYPQEIESIVNALLTENWSFEKVDYRKNERFYYINVSGFQ